MNDQRRAYPCRFQFNSFASFLYRERFQSSTHRDGGLCPKTQFEVRYWPVRFAVVVDAVATRWRFIRLHLHVQPGFSRFQHRPQPSSIHTFGQTVGGIIALRQLIARWCPLLSQQSQIHCRYAPRTGSVCQPRNLAGIDFARLVGIRPDEYRAARQRLPVGLIRRLRAVWTGHGHESRQQISGSISGLFTLVDNDRRIRLSRE